MRTWYLLCLVLAGCPKPHIDPNDDSVCTSTFSSDSYSWKSKDKCFADRSAFNAPGVVVYPCSHPGEATATFGPYKIEGKINKRRMVDVVYQSETVLGGSCSGVSVQRISGKVGGDFSFEYQEVPDHYGCATPCTATGTFEVESSDIKNH